MKVQEAIQVKPIYDVANSKLHYQTEPFIDPADGKLKVRRLSSHDVIVELVTDLVEQYTTTVNYGDSNE